MAERLLLCKRCRDKFPRSELVKVGSENFCGECADIIKTERRERESLYRYIRQVYQIPNPTGFMLKQIKKCHEEQQIPYSHIEGTLRYCFEVLHKQADPKYGISLVDYQYYNWLNYEKELKDIKSKQEIVEVDNAPQTLIIKRQKTQKYKRPLIDISKIGVD